MTDGSKSFWKVRSIHLYERHIPFRIPFRFGVIELREARQAVVRVAVEGEGGRRAEGVAAELMAVKWFDKSPNLLIEDNLDQLRASLWIARDVYKTAESIPLFRLSLEAGAEVQRKAGGRLGLPALCAGFGASLLDRAFLDALSRSEDMTVSDAVRRNLVGFDPETLLPGADRAWVADFLADRPTPRRIAIRHTIGWSDPLTIDDITPLERVDDGLPVSLEEAIAFYGLHRFKIALTGASEEMLDRLERIAAVLGSLAKPYSVSVDCSEQFDDPSQLVDFLAGLEERPGLAELRRALLYIEQPFDRGVTWQCPLGRLATRAPFLIDEADDHLDAFPRARRFGYRGVSFKGCKGIYKGLLNAARVARWHEEAGPGTFLSAEDLTCQVGVSLNQDTAFAALLGVPDNQRNAYHYVNGMPFGGPAERERLLAEHGDLYHGNEQQLHLRISEGEIDIASLWRTPGFAGSADPEWSELQPLRKPRRRFQLPELSY